MAIFNLFGKKGKLGIDIGTAAIKIVELEKSGGRFALKNYGLFELKGTDVQPTGPGAGQSILKLPDQEIVWGLKELIKKGNIKSTDAIASIPSFSTFTTIIEMPYLSEQELAKALPFEARKYIPIPLNEVNLDWSIIDVSNPVSAGSSGLRFKPTTVQVFIAAVPKDETEKYRRIMKGVGLNLKALELENTALIRALLGNDLSPTAIVNIGGRSTSIVIVDKGYERVSHNYEIGGFEITKSIARSLNVSIEKAEELKRKMGMNKADENIVNEAMVSLIDMMVFETKKTISSYEGLKKQKISRVLLVGGLTNMPSFVSYFKQKLNMDIYSANAFARIIYPESLKPIIQELANTFSIAAGLAMREV
ncbi:MAG: type IV pilus assembly protein PilM [Candidatus Yanofskybacteria bacterium]|nr:type IV pilus assembly protein PilM [Candidatus Yanofskybacteria bacterium]